MTRNAVPAALAILLAGGLALGGCHHKRKATADTGTAEATVKTTAPANVVSASDLQQQAQSAADAASTPVTNATTTTTTSNTAH